MHSITQSFPSVGLNPGSPTSQSTSTAPRRSSKSHEEQRKEIYAIRHINWKRRSDSPVQNISILVQNENGPCPLLALVNAIVLRAEPPTKSPVAKALEHRERISLGLLIQALLEELLNTTDGDLPDIEDLSTFLTMLHTGITFGVNLVHGWLAQPSSDTAQSLRRQKAIYYEDAEVLEIEANTFTDRIMKGEELTASEELRMLDIERITRFTKVDNATQISEYGLACLQQALQPGSISVLFRNNHFATLYKHPETLTLFTLVTDAGFASRPEVVWESLDDLRGNRTRFLSGDFLPVGGGGDNSRGGSAGTHIGSLSAAANPQVPGVPMGP
ncbi:hypothetical protein KEM56_004852 [Ascosphaera pollenicola]|nr:hypothetical protein KEM56_004852 [Ascosphaera pollenicola]